MPQRFQLCCLLLVVSAIVKPKVRFLNTYFNYRINFISQTTILADLYCTEWQTKWSVYWWLGVYIYIYIYIYLRREGDGECWSYAIISRSVRWRITHGHKQTGGSYWRRGQILLQAAPVLSTLLTLWCGLPSNRTKQAINAKSLTNDGCWKYCTVPKQKSRAVKQPGPFL